MDRYLEIQIRPDPEFPTQQLMNALFAKLHRALVAHGGNDIGVSFPDVADKPLGLGPRIRLHGSGSSLDRLMGQGWLVGLRDHIEQTPLNSVPANIKYRCVQRVQAKSNPERLRRRLMRRHGLDAEAAAERIPDTAAESLRLPYVQLASSSTGRHFRLFIRHGPLLDKPVCGQFSSYGLSCEATVPWFF